MFERLEVSTCHRALPTGWDDSEDNLYELVFQELGVLWFLKIVPKIVLLGPRGKLMIYKVVVHEFAHTRA
eukprot:8213734-Ditylum_brightwellii.AAC.1